MSAKGASTALVVMAAAKARLGKLRRSRQSARGGGDAYRASLRWWRLVEPSPKSG